MAALLKDIAYIIAFGFIHALFSRVESARTPFLKEATKEKSEVTFLNRFWSTNGSRNDNYDEMRSIQLAGHGR